MNRVERRRSRVLRIAVVAASIALASGLAASSRAQPEPGDPEEPVPAEAPPSAPTPSDTATQAAAKPSVAAKPPAEIPKPTERAWVRGEVRVNYRASASPNATPLGVLTTGDGVGVIERRGGWARVLVGESSVGWVPESYLAAEPPPREHLVILETQVSDLQRSLDETEREAGSLRAQVAELSGKEAERDEEIRRLRDENRDLQAGERWPYMVMGAGILAIGFVVGLLFRGGSRRSYSRLRY